MQHVGLTLHNHITKFFGEEQRAHWWTKFYYVVLIPFSLWLNALLWAQLCPSLPNTENAWCIKMFSKFIPCAFQGPISILPYESLLGLDRLQVKEIWTRKEKQELLDASSIRDPGHQPGQSGDAWDCARRGVPLLTPPVSPSTSWGTQQCRAISNHSWDSWPGKGQSTLPDGQELQTRQHWQN